MGIFPDKYNEVVHSPHLPELTMTITLGFRLTTHRTSGSSQRCFNVSQETVAAADCRSMITRYFTPTRRAKYWLCDPWGWVTPKKLVFLGVWGSKYYPVLQF